MRPLGVLFAAVAFAATPACVGTVDVGESSSGLAVCAKGPVVKGVDVSHYDGTIDWAAVHKGGIAFAIMKATENTGFVDPTFATNWKAAGDNGVIRGAYHFFRPAADATAQADFFVKTAGVPGAGDLPPTIDLEVTDNLDAATVASDALTFLARVQEKTGRTPIVYTSDRVLSGLLGSPAGFGAYTLWVANWQVTCPKIPSPPWSDWTLWQDSATGMVPGIASAVDTDQFNGTLGDLQNWVNGTSGAPDGGVADGGSSDGGNGDGDGDAGSDGAGDGGDGTGGNGGDDGGKADSPGAGPHMSGGCSLAVAAHAPASASWLVLFVFALGALYRKRGDAQKPGASSAIMRAGARTCCAATVASAAVTSARPSPPPTS